MKKFRRSTKSDKSDVRPRVISQKDAIAIVPPKKVIKAIYEYRVQNPEQNPAYLSFAQGDFLHVVGREDDPDWYEACNPMHGTRGLVPVNYFELVGKTARNSDTYEPAGRVQSVTGHDSGYSERSTNRNSSKGVDAVGAQPRTSNGVGRGSGAMVYGIVQYDFKAERPDELEASAGEAIIVIAQSNPEWFVAKPITRLGGPGLIPVSFIEIRDMSTGKAVDDTQAAVQRAGVPKVEEWKKMAADYKNSSIPLGRLEAQNAPGARSSLTNRRSQDASSQATDTRSAHLRNGSTYQANNQSFQSFQTTSQQRMSSLVMPLKAKVPRFIHQNEQYWFVVEAIMEDNRHWELSRQYKDFYGLQMSLKDRFPEEAGVIDGHPRTLPFMPGPVPYVTDAITAGRCKHLDEYLKNLLMLGQHIVSCDLVKRFFAPRSGDYELEPDADDSGYRLSTASHQSSTPVSYNSQQSTPGHLQPQAGSWASPPRSQPQTQPYGAGSQQQLPTHYRNTSDLRVPNGTVHPPMLRQNSAMTQASANSQGTGVSASGPSGQGPTPNPGGALKIKVWFGESNCVVIRLPSDFNFTSLVQKLRDRWALEPGGDNTSNKDEVQFVIEYKDEQTGVYYQMKNDDELDDAMNRNEKLTLRVTPVQGEMV